MWNLFDETVDYPIDCVEEGVPRNTLFCYISDSYLNGFINYVNNDKAVMIKRYREEGAYSELISSFGEQYHSKLSILPDDVLIAGSSKNSYWFFWYDKDNSDCCIGQFDQMKCSKGQVISLNLKGWISS